MKKQSSKAADSDTSVFAESSEEQSTQSTSPTTEDSRDAKPLKVYQTNSMYSLFCIAREGGGHVPEELNSQYTSAAYAQKALDAYLARQ